MRTWLISSILAFLLAAQFFVAYAFDPHSEICLKSEYNPTSHTGAMRFFGKCYFQITVIYESTERCGAFGISCRDVKPYMTSYTQTVCFRLKDGARC